MSIRGKLSVAALVAIALFWTWRGSAPAREQPLESSLPHGAEMAKGEPRSGVPSDLAVEPASRVPVEGREGLALLPGASVAPAKGRIFGALLDTEGASIRGLQATYVRLVDPKGARTSYDASARGTFEFNGLELGTYWIQAQAFTYCVVEETIELRADAPVLRKDFVLPRPTEVLVRVETPDGRDLYEVMHALQLPEGAKELVPVATREKPGERFEGIVGSRQNKFGIGHFWWYGPRGGPLPPGYVGLLVVDGGLPAWVSLVHHQVVIESKRVEVGATEVSFVLAPEDLVRNLATIRLRVVDAETALPLVGADVRLMTEGRTDTRVQCDSEGLALVEESVPGQLRLTITVEGHERYHAFVDAPPAKVTDLGTFALDREIRLTGRTLDPEGRPHKSSLVIGTLDPVSGSVTWPSPALDTAVEGGFEFTGLGRRQYVVRTRNHDLASFDPHVDTLVSGNVVVDLRTMLPTPLDVRLRQATKLILRLEDGAQEGMRFRVVDELGLELVRSRFYETRPRMLLLAPGDHRIVLIDPTGNVIRERSVLLGAEPVELDLGQ